jgi:hypothetical protein
MFIYFDIKRGWSKRQAIFDGLAGSPNLVFLERITY